MDPHAAATAAAAAAAATTMSAAVRLIWPDRHFQNSKCGRSSRMMESTSTAKGPTDLINNTVNQNTLNTGYSVVLLPNAMM
jgi:hypothetical protein